MMICLSYTTPTMLRQRSMPGLVTRVSLVSRFAGRIAPTSGDGGGGDP
jgi:hypothetical protein